MEFAEEFQMALNESFDFHHTKPHGQKKYN